MKKEVKRPCQGCIYFKDSRETTRTEKCKGRKTKREKEREENKNGNNLVFYNIFNPHFFCYLYN